MNCFPKGPPFRNESGRPVTNLCRPANLLRTFQKPGVPDHLLDAFGHVGYLTSVGLERSFTGGAVMSEFTRRQFLHDSLLAAAAAATAGSAATLAAADVTPQSTSANERIRVAVLEIGRAHV